MSNVVFRTDFTFIKYLNEFSLIMWLLYLTGVILLFTITWLGFVFLISLLLVAVVAEDELERTKKGEFEMSDLE